MAASTAKGLSLWPTPIRRLTRVEVVEGAMDEESTFWNTVRATSITGLDPSNLPRSGVLRCRASGLRPKDRPELWLFLSGGAAMAADHPAGTYASLTKASRLPKEILYAIDDDAAGRQPVRRLLVAAYNHLGAAAARDAAAAGRAKPDPSAPAPTLSPQSYCRGLASLASFVLAVQGAGREEQAFWTLAALLERRLFSYACTPGACPAAAAAAAAPPPAAAACTLASYSLGVRVEARTLDQLAARKLPAISAHLAKLDSSVAALLAPWLPGAFSSVLPPEVAARLLDCVLVEGSKVLLRAGLALLKLHATTILGSCSVQQLRKVLEARMGRLADPEQLLSAAFKGVGSMGHERIALTRAGALRTEEARAQELAAQLAQVIGPAKRTALRV